ncbi:unnamed protein product [Lactuca saligna]|uniref:Uncharacterized protein n=1 Tax=Lactuca saligna TaxID=75948 RepID=A0AA36E957_LACSI|nr:unnamed protein product [Lactuca saligna]
MTKRNSEMRSTHSARHREPDGEASSNGCVTLPHLRGSPMNPICSEVKLGNGSFAGGEATTGVEMWNWSWREALFGIEVGSDVDRESVIQQLGLSQQDFSSTGLSLRDFSNVRYFAFKGKESA